MKRSWFRGWVGVLAVALSLSGVARADEASRRARLAAVESWGVQLQGPNGRPLRVAPIENSRFDLVVVDGSNGDRPFRSAEVERMKRHPRGRARVVLAYLSIGEAEEYRGYWRSSWRTQPPSFLSAENPSWEGNYKVRYWEPEWQAIVFAELERLIAAGFDGVYLDVVDAYEWFGPGGQGAERASAAEDMAEFVVKLSAHARTTLGAPDFLIVPQNGSSLIDLVSDATRSRYFAAIDALGSEDTFFPGIRPEDNRPATDEETLARLRRFRDAGKRVLILEYVTTREYLRLLRHHARREGFVAYAGRRALDRL